MPFGLPVWVYLWGIALALLALSLLVGHRWATRTSAVILTCYVLVGRVDSLPISSELKDLAAAALWVVASGFVPLVGLGGGIAPLVVRSFMALSGSCYLWSRLAGAKPEFGSLPFVIADLLLIAAMMLIGWTLRHDIHRIAADVGRGRILGRDHSGCGAGSVHPVSGNQVQTAKEVE